MNKKINSILSITITVLVLFLSTVFFFTKKINFSENENRYLAVFPKFTVENLTSGKYMEDIKNYLSDHFPFRDAFMGLRANVYKTTGQYYLNGVYLGQDGYLLEKFEGEENQKKIIERLQNFASSLEDVSISFLLAPTSTAIYAEKLPEYAYNQSQIDIINSYYDLLDFNEIYVYDTLLKEKNNYSLYYKLDHHWTTYGAYFAYISYCESNNITPHLLDEFEQVKVSDSFYGTYYSKANDYSLKPDSIYRFDLENDHFKVTYVNSNVETDTFYEDIYLTKKDKYSYFLDNNHPLIVIENETIASEEEIVVIKDSYANCFVPFLARHYKKVHVIDPRYYKLPISTYIKEQTIKNILFLYNVGTLDSDLGILSVR